jgi:uncharacterized pyridoxal phosphate-containing UPF0001 family protein
MTMGPRFGDPEQARSYLQATRAGFGHPSTADLRNATTSYLATGMSNSYLVALKEGAKVVRIGIKVFGPRPERA